MRCRNCGWPNKPSETICVKCGSPLSVNDDDIDSMNENSVSQPSSSLNKTVLEEDIFGGVKNTSAQQPNISQSRIKGDKALEQCPKCGYPLRSGVDKCPNCKFQIGATRPSNSIVSTNSRDDDFQTANTVRHPTRMESGKQANSFRGTINPYMMNIEIEPTFILKPIKRVGERQDFNDQEYEGKQVVLNRDNTEQKNSSITSRQQAVITNVDGHWFIEDKSEQRTTFVQAAQKIELHDGDIILLGNRLFEFHK